MRKRRRFPGADLALLALLLVVAATHLYVRSNQPDPKLVGDETHYFAYATQDVLAGDTSLFPGRLRFDHRPELVSRVLAQLQEGEARTLSNVELEQEIQRRLATGEGVALLRRATVLNLALLLVLLALTHGTARLLRISAAGALTATALLGLFPWFGFHVHSLWPEVLHGLLFGVAFFCIATHLLTRRIGWLFPAGLITGYALFAKATLIAFLPLAILFLFAAGWFAERESRLPLRVQAALGPGLLYAGAVAVMIFPQLLMNALDNNGWKLSANRWWNLELGLTIPYESNPPEGIERWKPAMATSLRYWQAAATPDERERLARQRTREYVKERGVFRLTWDQTKKFFALLFTGEPFLEQSLTYRQRWGAAPPDWLQATAVPGRVLWYVILAFGLFGCAVKLRANAAWAFVGLFVLYMGGALFLIPVKMRFLMPVVPFLCLGAGGAVDWIRTKIATARSPAKS